jgi:hypothetical protein
VPLELAAAATLALAAILVVGCAGDETKRVAGGGGEGGDAGEAGEGGPPFTSGGSSSEAGARGDGNSGATDQGGGGEASVNSEGGTGGAPVPAGGNAGQPTSADAGQPASGDAGAAGVAGQPATPISICGPGKWSAGEGQCGTCPATTQIFELTCADYPGGQIFANLGGTLQFAFVNLPAGVAVHEAPPKPISVVYVTPDQSFTSEVRFGISAWSVDLSNAPDPPAALVIPPFTAVDACGDTFRSLEPTRFERASPAGSAYVLACP